MKISLLTDAPKHNLALMKLSTWHKHAGDVAWEFIENAARNARWWSEFRDAMEQAGI